MNAARDFVTRDQARIRYELAGSGPAVVFIHGFALDLRMWDPQWSTMAGAHQVLRYDARGFGASDAPDGRPYRHLDDLLALMAALELDRAALVGLSMGGGIAIDFALEYPERVTAVAALATTLGGYAWDRRLAGEWGEVGRVARDRGLSQARRQWIEQDMFGPARRQPEVAAALERMVEDFGGWPWLHRDTGAGAEPPAVTRLAQLRCPVLALVGDRDLPDFQAIASLLGREAPFGHRIVVPGAGHLVNMEAPRRCTAALTRFLAAHARPRAG